MNKYILYFRPTGSFLSSANRNVNNWEQLGRSLMYRRKRRGPKTEPWGTPIEIFKRELLQLLKEKSRLRLDR